MQASGENINGAGTGIFVAPRLLITCRHVLASTSGLLESGTLDCFVNSLAVIQFRLVHGSSEEIDLALLEAIDEPPAHGWVRLARDGSPDLEVEYLSKVSQQAAPRAEGTRFSIEGTKERGSLNIWSSGGARQSKE